MLKIGKKSPKGNKENREPARIKLPKDKKPPVNRKLLVWVFLLTGLVSLFFWLRGRFVRGVQLVGEVPSGEMRWVIEPTGQETVNSNSDQVIKVLDQVREITATVSGTYAVYVKRLDGTGAYGFNEDVQMPGASLLKLPAMITVIEKVERGDLDLTDKYTLEEADRAVGSGPLQFKQAGTSYTLDELLNYLGKNSDNTAWVMFNRRLGGEEIELTMKKMGLMSSDYGELTTTARDVSRMWEYLYGGGISPSNQKRVWGYLTESIYEDRLPAGLESTGAEIVGHKVGTDIGVWADAGIIKCRIENGECRVEPFILVIMNDGVKRAEAMGIVPEIAKMIWTFENSTKGL